MERCPKCGYERQLDNGECNPSSECPQCGIVYVKYEAYLSRMQAEQKKAERMAEEQASIQPPFEGQRDIQSKFRIKAFLRDLLKKHLQGEKLSWFLSIIRNSPPVQWLDKNKDRITLLLSALWILECGYWLYRLLTVSSDPHQQWWILADLAVLEPRDALTILFFGGIISFFLLGLILFLFRFALNLIWGGIICRIPSDWHSFATSIILIVLVSISFPMIEEVKMAGRIAYCHVTELVRIAKNHDMTIRIDAASMKKTKRFTNEQEF